MVAPAEASPPVRIDVRSSLGRYAVVIGAGILQQARTQMTALGLSEPHVVVSSSPIWKLQAERIQSTVTGEPVLMQDGERAKNLRSVAAIYDAFAARGVDRAATIVAFGGGVVGDVAGFAAATYLRGLRYVQVPTTLLAQVDSAIGGKVGVNLPAGKNLAGSFHPPALVLVDPDVLDTLPRREFRAGMYEVVKYGVIASRGLFETLARGLRKLMSRDRAVLSPVIAECCGIKARVVSEDEFESGPRRVLNFGHTVGHALEAVSGYRRFRHGEAVAYGMLAAAHISASRGQMPFEDRDALVDLIRRLGALPRVSDLRADDLLDAMTRDKKRISGTLHFVLSAGIGKTYVAQDVSTDELRSALVSIGIGR